MAKKKATADAITKELRARIERLRKGVVPIMADMVKVAELQIRRNASLTDHTLKDLKKLRHPYRVREGGFARTDKKGRWRAGIRKKARQEREHTLGHDIKLVHTQGGGLLHEVYSEVREGENTVTAVAGVHDKFEYLTWLVYGTSKMIPRDFIGIAGIQSRSEMYAIMRTGLNALARQLGLKRR